MVCAGPDSMKAHPGSAKPNATIANQRMMFPFLGTKRRL
jgi:hypothetical protein